MDRTAFLAPLLDRPLIRKLADAGFVRLAHSRVRQLDALDAAAVQRQTLLKFVRHAADTRFGRDHRFAHIHSWADYRSQVPIRTYEFFWQNYWKNYPILDNETWPGKVPYYALSSGTTSGATKYLPITWEMVQSNRKAAHTTLSLFRHAFPKHETFTGKFFFLGGNTAMTQKEDGSFAGDLSAIAAREVPAAVRPYTFPPLELSRMSDWKIKMQKLAEASAKENIVALSGVPSWMAFLFDTLKTVTGKATIREIWPNFRLLIHGGTKFDAFREPFRQTIGGSDFEFCEVYPASEGFIATEDPRYHLLRLVPDHDVVFEFVPLEDIDQKSGEAKPHAARHTLDDLELNVVYAVAVTSCSGVWSYLLGDTVVFESRRPPLLRFAGRTKNFLSAFGEHLIEEEVEKAIAHAAKVCGTFASDYHVGPVFASEPNKPGFHRYLVEFRGVVPDLNRFAHEVDAELNRLNEDYAAHRVDDLTMVVPEVIAVVPGGFRGWVEARKGTLDVQTKVPRMDNDGKLTQQAYAWLTANGKINRG